MCVRLLTFLIVIPRFELNPAYNTGCYLFGLTACANCYRPLFGDQLMKFISFSPKENCDRNKLEKVVLNW